MLEFQLRVILSCNLRILFAHFQKKGKATKAEKAKALKEEQKRKENEEGMATFFQRRALI